MTEPARPRRSLRYIRLAAYLAGQPTATERLILSTEDIESVVGDTLPPGARFPSWWRNDHKKMHSRAWLAAGWEVVEMRPGESKVVFLRSEFVT